jgi:hypothetical protein
LTGERGGARTKSLAKKARKTMKNGIGLEIVDVVENIDHYETLVWNQDGFCWLRGVNGETREFEGIFSNLPQALNAARTAGFEPTGVWSV